MKEKVLGLLKRLDEVEALLAQPDILSDQEQYKALSQEHSRLNDIKEDWNAYQSVEEQLVESNELLRSEKDPELSALIQEDIAVLEPQVDPLRLKLEGLLVPPDPRDNRDIIVELRAGTGGDEAALFVGDCVRMYHLYADRMGWQCELISAADSDIGGYKEYMMGIRGKDVFRFMQYEAGTHRVQRVPKTETQGRVHTSAITVAVLLEPGEEEKIVLDEKELKIDTYRASGAGGQHVNTTDSAVRITHVPSGAVAYCSQERSQHKNKDTAMRLLIAKISEKKQREEHAARAGERSAQIGSGDRSERIRTYNYPQNRVTDHRIDLTLYKLDFVMQGELEGFSQALVSYYYQEKLTS